MTDLNDWRLDYDGATALDFGTLESDFPFSAQVEIGDVDTDDQDLRHPNSDGLVMGRDSLGGFTLTFNLTTLPDFQGDPKPWDAALDLFSTFKSRWRADSVRRVPGAYASLSNLDRSRMVYGRPRKMSQKNDRLRKGLLAYVATFDTNGPDWLDTMVKAVPITPAPAPAGGGIQAPIQSPITTVPANAAVSPTISNDGDLPAFPVVDFHGPGTGHSLELLAGATVLWKMLIPAAIKFDEVVTVDTRPWSRGVTVNGKPGNGRLRGTQIELCTIPPDTNLTYRYRRTDKTGTSYAAIWWQDAYASM